MQWLADNLPSNCLLISDEAYLHFHPQMEKNTLIPSVKRGQNVIISRSFSKIYGWPGYALASAAPALT